MTGYERVKKTYRATSASSWKSHGKDHELEDEEEDTREKWEMHCNLIGLELGICNLFLGNLSPDRRRF